MRWGWQAPSLHQRGSHIPLTSLSPGQSYEVRMLCDPKLSDATQWARLVKAGASPPPHPQTGKGRPGLSLWAGSQCHCCDVTVQWKSLEYTF